VFALIDCNNFFVSCEKIFNPGLEGKPVVVLSNNDGCVISRSNEAKAIGIPMGIAIHKCKDLIALHNVRLFSANFQLYGDVSNRIMSILKDFCSEMEIYSIDEAFLNLKNMKINDLQKYGQEIHDRIYRWTGVPVSVGISPTKTLCKAANEYLKVTKASPGLRPPSPKGEGILIDKCMTLNTPEKADAALSALDVGDIWGIGRKYSEFLNRYGMYRAIDLKNADDRWVRTTMSVVGQRTVFELRGTPCIELDAYPEAKKMIISSRSFGRYVTTKEELKESVACYTARAATKLRSQGSVCGIISVAIMTNRHRANLKQYYGTTHCSIPTPTGYTPDLVKHAFKCLDEIYKPGYKYKKALVTLSSIVPEDSGKINMFEQDYAFEKNNKIMKAFDDINKAWGKEKIRIGAMGETQPWRAKREMVSPRYTTVWEEILVINN